MNELPLSWAGSDGWVRRGVVRAASALSISVAVPGLTPGMAVGVERKTLPPLVAEVIDVSAHGATCLPLECANGVGAGSPVTSMLARVGAYVGEGLLGQATDAWGRCEMRGPLRVARTDPTVVALRDRSPICDRLQTGVAAIDAFAPLGHGQRVALFAGAGVGKTTLLRRILEEARVDARVVALVGERGREASELAATLRKGEHWPSTTLVCATAEASPVERLAAARTATAQAEDLAARGSRVLLVVDSLTRVAAAWREIALAAGEAPAHRGYPPSMVGVLARLVERAGARRSGAVTGVYAVLVDGDDPGEPVTDSIRALLDGHVTLSRALAEAGRFPAIDVLRSMSRVAADVTGAEHQRDAAEIRRAIAALERAEDLFAIGAYRPGGDIRLDAAVAVRDDIERLIFDDGRNARNDPVAALASIASRLRAAT